MGFTVDTAALLVTVDRAHNHFCIQSWYEPPCSVNYRTPSALRVCSQSVRDRIHILGSGQDNGTL